MNVKQICGVIFALGMAAVAARADSLELKNGSLIKGKFMGGSQASITYQVGSLVQSYDVADLFAPIRFRTTGCLTLHSLEAADCTFDDGKRRSREGFVLGDCPCRHTDFGSHDRFH
jgi:hypothetical protein